MASPQSKTLFSSPQTLQVYHAENLSIIAPNVRCGFGTAPLMTKPIVLRHLIRYNTFRSYLPFNISYIYEPAIIKFKAKISIKDEQTVTEMDKYKTSNSFKTKKKRLLYVRGLSLVFVYHRA